ncbi:unnamed protein product [Phytophthora fragariaefolia]|uniref:Unnamed protein product n=1 Tax=Phytophthora fragariaefolia TaxID=1490495 RepID=A0A9W6Y1E9_9STRA|nr:unnamed protein product [Phytophthora fragariaefolia]
MRVKDLRRERYIVTRAMIIFMAQEIMPQFFAEKTVNAAMCWCARLTLRRVTTRGRESREDMFILKAQFCDEVRRVIAESVIPLSPGIDPRCKAFNMDQTAIYASTSAYTTVEEVGVRVVPALTVGSDSQCITMAVLVRADGVVLSPHFVFKGQPGGEVEKELQSYVPPHVATCSVQENAWFDERVMHEWINHSFKPNVTSYSLLLLDTLKPHKMDSVLDAQAAVLNALPTNSAERRRYMFDHVLSALSQISSDTVRHSFDKAGPFFGCTTTSEVQCMLEEARLLNVVDVQDNDASL